MQLKKIAILLIGAAMWVLPHPGFTQVSSFDKVGTTSFQFLSVVPNARASGMGGASAAVIQRSEAVFFNPALLTTTTHLDVAAAYVDWFLDVSISSLSFAYSLPGFGTIGILAQATNIGEIEETRVDHLFRDETTGRYNPGTTGNTVSANSIVVGISYARDLTDKFAFGVTAKYARENLAGQAAANLMFDGGIVYRTGYKSLMLGAMLQHFGPDVKYFNESYPLPQRFSIGLSGYAIGPDASLFAHSDKHRLLLAYDLAQTRDHSQQQHIGAEYRFAEFLSLRAGYKVNFDEEGLTFGAGLNVKNFRLDYAYNDFGSILENVQRFTVTFHFD